MLLDGRTSMLDFLLLMQSRDPGLHPALFSPYLDSILKASDFDGCMLFVVDIISHQITSLRRSRYLRVRLRSSRARLSKVAAASAAAGVMIVSVKSSRPSWYAV